MINLGITDYSSFCFKWIKEQGHLGHTWWAVYYTLFSGEWGCDQQELQPITSPHPIQKNFPLTLYLVHGFYHGKKREGKKNEEERKWKENMKSYQVKIISIILLLSIFHCNQIRKNTILHILFFFLDKIRKPNRVLKKNLKISNCVILWCSKFAKYLSEG